MYLTVENGPRGRQTVALEGSITVGSSPDCDLRIESPGVALHHAVVKPLRGGGFGVKSVDGPILVDGDDVPAARLEEGTQVSLGPIQLRVIAEEEPEPIPVAVRPAAGGAAVTSAGSPGGKSPSKSLGGYRLLGVLGKGGMGVVHRAEQVSLNREVALKVLSKDLTKDPMFVGKFVAEARHAARLHHPNVVQVFDVDHEGDTYFYPMELMEKSLEAVIRTEGKLDPDRALSVIRDAASGLAYAESLRIVHRDIKPDNIMLDRHGTAKLCDLGLAQGDEGDQSGKVSGTPHFMAPEQALRRDIDHRTDLYALGCTFYRVLTGHTPFQGKTVKDILRAHVKDAPMPPHKVDPEVPAEISPVVLKLLEKEPDDRYQSAEEFVEALDELTAPPQRKGLIYGAVGLAVAAIGVAIWAANQDAKVIDRTKTVIDQTAVREADALRKKEHESNARIALLQIQSGDLQGAALAERLEELATSSEHGDTLAAQEAAEQATTVRAEMQRVASEQAALQRRVQQAVTDLTTSTRTALDAERWFDAQKLVTLDAVAEDLRNLPELAAAGSSLGEELRLAVADGVAARTQAIATAKDNQDPVALREAAAALRAVIEGSEAWPPELVAEREALKHQVAGAEGAAKALEVTAAAEERKAAWQAFDGGVAATLAQHIAALDLKQAAAEWTALADGMESAEPATRARALAESARQAETALARIETALASDQPPTLTYGEMLLVPVVALTRTGPQAGLTIKTGSRSRSKKVLIPMAEVTADQWRELTDTTQANPAAQDIDPGSTSLLAMIALHRTVTEARGWLANLRADDDATGTGEQSFAGAPMLLDTLGRRAKAAGAPPWMVVLAEEVRAADQLTDALRAISERRNRAGEVLLRSILEQHPHALVVLGLP